MKRILPIILTIAMLFAITACGSSESSSDSNSSSNSSSSNQGSSNDGDKKQFKNYKWKIGINTPEGSLRDVAAKKMKEVIEAKTNGAVKIEIYPSETLGTEQEMVESVQTGSLEFELVSSGALSNIIPEDAILSLPFIINNFEEAHAVLDGPIGNDFIKPLYEQHGFKVLGFTDLGFTQITNNVKPINSAEDLKGIKMRSPNEAINIKTFEQLGSSVITMPFSEVYLGLSQGVVEGQFNPLDAIYENKFHEVQDYLAITNHVYYYVTFIMNKDLWDSLDPELQKIVQEASKEAEKVSREFAAKQDKEMLDKLKDSFKEITYPDTNEFRNAIEPAYAEFEKVIPKASIEKVKKALEEYRASKK